MFKNLVLASVLSTAFMSAASASQISVSDFSGSETVISMNNAPANTGPFTYQGLTFSESSSDRGWRNLTGYGYGYTDNAGISNITISLDGAYGRAGLAVYIGPATYTVTFFDQAANALGSVTQALGNNTSYAFFGWESNVGIASLNIQEVSGDNGHVGGFNNVRFENQVVANVPEPGSLALLGLGMLGFAARKRKAAGK